MHMRDAMFKLAYLTDPHLAPLPRPSPLELANKRILGYLNWQLSRKMFHVRDVLDRITADMLDQNPDHIAIGGDLVNLSLRDEFALALDWLQTLGSPEKVSVIPGNHDAYVPMNQNAGLGLWRAYMTGDVRQSKKLAPVKDGFPWVRRFGKVALIGLSSAVPTLPFFASGKLGRRQREALTRQLKELGASGFFRVVMVHHPPLVGLTGGRRRGLTDAKELEAILEREGAELVLFGHRHFHSLTPHPTDNGDVLHALGGPSASAAHGAPEELARYYLIHIGQTGRRWTCEIEGRGMTVPDSVVGEIERVTITE